MEHAQAKVDLVDQVDLVDLVDLVEVLDRIVPKFRNFIINLGATSWK